jgi:hypothetical protein
MYLNEVVTISRWDDFYVEFKEPNMITTSTTHETDDSWGLDETAAEISKKFGAPLRRKEVDAKIDGTFAYDYDHHYEGYNSLNETYSYEFSRETTRDDVVSAEVTYYEIWRYPAYGMEEPDANGNTLLAYMDIVMPSSLPNITTTQATTFDGWEPAWENGNISLSVMDRPAVPRPTWVPSASLHGGRGGLCRSATIRSLKKEVHDGWLMACWAATRPGHE